MPLSPRHWRARHLLGAWIAYWAALLAVTLGPGVLALRRIRGAPENTSHVNFSFGDQGLQGNIVSYGTTLWSVHVGPAAVVLWLVVPPLLLWLLWAALRPRPESLAGGQGPRAVGAGAAAWQAPAPADRDAVRPPSER